MAIRAVSTYTRAVGWYALGDRRPVAEQRLPCTWESISRHGQLRGIVHLPSGERVGGYPFGDFDESLQWRRPLDDWLAELGRHVYENVRFRLGLVGMEVSGEIDAGQLASGVPTTRVYGLVVPEGTLPRLRAELPILTT